MSKRVLQILSPPFRCRLMRDAVNDRCLDHVRLILLNLSRSPLLLNAFLTQDARETQLDVTPPAAPTVTSAAMTSFNGAVSNSKSLNLPEARKSTAVGEGWDWDDGLGLGGDGEASPDPPIRVASLSLRGGGQTRAGAEMGTRGDVAARKEAAAKRREARK